MGGRRDESRLASRMLIDSHCHITPPGFELRRAELADRDATFASMFSTPRGKLATAEALVRDMDRDGVDMAVAMGLGWSSYELAQENNDCVIESVACYPGRLVGFCTVNPAWGKVAVAEVERCAANGLRGIGELHPDTQGFDITDAESLSPLMDTARRLRLPVLIHCSEPVGHEYPGKGRTTPEKVYRFICNFPDNVIICAHWGGGLPFYALMPEVPDVIRNVYFDSAASPFLYQPGVYNEVARLVGPDKVMFASDYPLMSAARALKHMDEAGLDPETRSAITASTAAALFGF